MKILCPVIADGYSLVFDYTRLKKMKDNKCILAIHTVLLGKLIRPFLKAVMNCCNEYAGNHKQMKENKRTPPQVTY